MNDKSSRSHTILLTKITQINTKLGKICESKLFLVDLAGSERIKKSKVEGELKREAIKINQSLMVLGKVITSLSSGKSHVPFYESKLTQILKG